jgi:hypothetical protein
MVTFILPNGEQVPVPADVVGTGAAAEQGFYDGQIARLAAEAASVAAPVTEGVSS